MWKSPIIAKNIAIQGLYNDELLLHYITLSPYIISSSLYKMKLNLWLVSIGGRWLDHGTQLFQKLLVIFWNAELYSLVCLKKGSALLS